MNPTFFAAGLILGLSLPILSNAEPQPNQVKSGKGIAEGDVYQVVSKRIDLYRNGRRAPKVLYRGELIRARPLPDDDEWLVFRRQNTTWKLRRRGTQSQVEMERQLGLALAGVENQLEDLQDQLNEQDVQREDLTNALRQIEWDELASYLMQPTLTLYSNKDDEKKNGHQNVNRDIRTIQPTRFRKLKSSTASRLKRKLTKQLQKIEEDSKAIRQQIVAGQKKRIRLQFKQQAMRDRFLRFQLDPENYLHQWYRATEPAALYRDTRVQTRLRRGEWVDAARKPGQADRLIVYRNDGLYDARRQAFQRLDEVRRDFALRQMLITRNMDAITHERRRLQSLRRQLHKLMLQMDIQSQTSGTYLVVGGSSYNARHALEQTTGILEVLDRSRTRRLLRKWQKILDETEHALADVRTQAGSIKRKQVELQAEQMAFQQTLQQLTHNVPPAVDPK